MSDVGESKQTLRELSATISPWQFRALQKAALLRAVDERVFNALIRDRGAKKISFKKFSNLAEVAPTLGGAKSVYVRDEPRRIALGRWKEPELRRFSARVARYYRRGDVLDRIASLAVAEPAKALRLCEREYNAADRRGDLDQCEAVLRVLRNRSVLIRETAPALFTFLLVQEQYLRSRVLFIDDWMLSTHYLERPILTRQVEKFLRHRTKWLMQIYAKGGLGKTAFLRWLISRRLIVRRGEEARHPVARIDLDRINKAAIAEHPSLLLLAAEAQLDQQMADVHGSSLFPSLSSSSRLLAAILPGPSKAAHAVSVSDAKQSEIEAEFIEQLGDRPALIVVDTIEELVLHRPSEWLRLLQLFDRVRSKCTGLKVIVSGRHDFTKREAFKGWFRKRASRNGTTTISVPPFDQGAAFAYLTKVRRLKPTFRSRRLLPAANASPFKLALFADVLGANGKFTLDDLANLRRSEIDYLIRRIIDRVPDAELQWLLRYAVVPNTLTREFAQEVLLPHVRREAARGQQDQPYENLPADARAVLLEVRPWKPVESRFNVDELWSRLTNYASGSSWITMQGDVPRLQPELVVPMRYLLQHQDVYGHLHRDAAKYFEAKIAGSDLAAATAFAEEALYHWFQADGPDAATHWARLLDGPHGNHPRFRGRLAASLLGGNFIDDDDRPLKWRDGADLIGVEVIAAAHFERAAGWAFAALRENKWKPLLKRAQAHLGKLESIERKLGRRIVAESRRTHIEVLVLYVRRRAADALRLADERLRDETLDPSDRIVLLVARGHVLLLDHRPVEEAIGSYDAALALTTARQFAVWHDWLLARLGVVAFRLGDLERAREQFVRSIEALVSNRGTEHEIVSRAQALVGVLFQAARYSEVPDWLTFVANHVGDSEDGAAYIQDQQSRLDAVRMKRVYVSRLPAATKPAVMQWQAVHLAAEHDDAAVDVFRRAAQLFEMNGDVVSAQACEIDAFEYVAEVIGDYNQARALSSKLDPAGGNWMRGHLALIEATRRVSQNRAASLWRPFWTEAAHRGTLRERAVALAHGIVGKLMPVSATAELGRMLNSVRPAEARVTLLTPFEYWTGESPADVAPSFVEALPSLQSGDPDFVYRALPLAEALRFAGKEDEAAALLNQALSARPLTQDILLTRKILAGLQRLHAEVSDDLVDEFLTAADQQQFHLRFRLAISVEQAERYFAKGDWIRARQAVDRVSVREKEGRANQYQCRLLRLTAALRHERGDYDHAARLRREARAIAKRLGQPKLAEDLHVEQHERPMKVAAPAVPAAGTDSAPSFDFPVHLVKIEGTSNEELIVREFASAASFDDPTPIADRRTTVGPRLRELLRLRGSRTTIEQLLVDPQVAAHELRAAIEWRPRPSLFPGRDVGLVFDIDDDILGALPWEMIADDGRYLFVTRTSAELVNTETIRWVQQTLGRTEHTIAPDDVAGPDSIRLARQFGSFTPSDRDGVISSPGKVGLRDLLSTGRVLWVSKGYEYELSRRIGHGSKGIDSASLWEEVPGARRVDPDDLLEGLLPEQPDVIYIPLSVAEHGSELSLVTGSHDRPFGKRPLTPGTFTRALEEISPSRPRPFVILDVTAVPSRAEAVKQMFLRNQFAQHLYLQGGVRGVLATGLSDSGDRVSRAVIKAINRLDCPAQLARILRPVVGDLPSVVFAADPTIPIQ